MPTFILNDETKINSYGFRIPNNGGSFDRFDANSAMLDSHINSLNTILGSWKNRVIDGALLKADTNFDSEDPNVKPIEDKVNRGFIKGASMGVLFNPDYMIIAPDGVYELSKWELMEASLCAVPSNAGSLALLNQDGTLIPDKEVNLTIAQLSLKRTEPDQHTQIVEPKPIILNNQDMNNFAHVKTVDDFEKLSITQKDLFYNNNKAAYSALFAEQKGRCTSHEDARLYSAGGYGNTMLTSKVDAGDYNPSDIKTADDFEKLSPQAKLNYKAKYFASYKSLFVSPSSLQN